jgi:hypothetical protein
MAKYFALETLKGEDSIQASWNTNACLFLRFKSAFDKI